MEEVSSYNKKPFKTRKISDLKYTVNLTSENLYTWW